MKLKYKIALIFTSLSMVSIFIISTMIFNYGKDIIEKKTVEHLANTNELKTQQFEQWINHLISSLESLSQLKKIKEGLSNALIRKELRENYRQNFLSVVSPFVNDSFFVTLFIVDFNTGQVIFSSDNIQEGKFKDNHAFFVKGAEKLFVQDITFDISKRTPFMIMSLPLKNSHGKTIALLAGKTDLLGISQFMERWSEQIKTEDTFLVNKFKYYITEPRFQKGYALRKTYNDKKLMISRKKGSSIGTNIDYRDKPVLSAVKYLKKWNLYLVTKMDIKESYETIESLKRSVVILAMLIAVFSAALGFFFSFELSRPIEILSYTAKKIGEGDLDVVADLKKGSEFYDLAISFRNMAEKLKATMVSKKVLEDEVLVRIKVEKDLKETLEDLKQSNEDLQQFAYVASHDLQEPLRMVSSFTQLLSERYKDELDEKAQKWINFAVDGANRMQSLIQDLLSFSRVSTHGKKFSSIDTGEVIEIVLSNLSVSVEESDAVIIYEKLPEVRADKNQMVQLFQNLISNGIKFVEGKKPEIHVSAVKREKDWLFSVSDNGIGIEGDYFDKIFVIFQRLHSRDAFQGTGLGLAVCKRIVQRHGGEIWVESEVGRGACFYFTIPL